MRLIVLEFSNKVLDKNGVVVSKLFMGDDFEEIKVYAKKPLKKSIFSSQIQVEITLEKHIYIVID